MANDDNQSDHSIGSLLRNLLGVLIETDGSCRIVDSVRRNVGRTRVGHEFSISTSVDSEVERRSISAPTQSNPTNVHYDDVGAVVVVDLHGENITPEELAGGVTDTRGEPILAVATGRKIIERVPLHHGDFEITDAWFNNGVLEFQLQRESSSG